MSTASGSSRTGGATWGWSPDIFGPLLVLVDFAPHGSLEDLLDPACHRPRLAILAHEAVIDRTDRYHLGCGPGQKRFIRRVQIRPKDMADLGLKTEVPCDGHDRVLGDALEGAGRCGWRNDAAAPHDEDVLPRAFAHVALG